MWLAVLIAAPFVLRNPEWGTSVDSRLQAALAWLIRPDAWVTASTVAAGETGVTSTGELDAVRRAELDRERREVRALFATLSDEVASGTRLWQLPVLRSEGARPGKLPTQLVLDARVDAAEARSLTGRVVVRGEDLIGFVAPAGKRRSPSR